MNNFELHHLLDTCINLLVIACVQPSSPAFKHVSDAFNSLCDARLDLDKDTSTYGASNV